MRCFDERMRLKRGVQRTAIWRSASSVSTKFAFEDGMWEIDEPWRIVKARDAFDRGEFARSPWLDRLTLPSLQAAASGKVVPRAEHVADELFTSVRDSLADLSSAAPDAISSRLGRMYLEFPYFPYPVIFDDRTYHTATFSTQRRGKEVSRQAFAMMQNQRAKFAQQV